MNTKINDKKRAKYRELIEYLGGYAQAAASLGVWESTVRAWVLGYYQMSEINALRAERLTKGKFKAAELNSRIQQIEKMETL